MSELKNLIIAIILSTIVLATWQYFYASKISPEETTTTVSKTGALPDASSNINDNTNRILLAREDLLATSTDNRIKINNSRVHGSINLKGARIDDITLTEYKASLEPNSHDVVLLAPSGSKESYFAEFGWVSNDSNIKLPDANTLWHSDRRLLTVGHPIDLTWDNGQGLTFIIRISIDQYYMFNITQMVENNSNHDITLSTYGLLSKSIIAQDKTYSILHEGPIGVLDGVLSEVTNEDMEKERDKAFKNNKSGDWLGITDKYWLTAIVPSTHNMFNAAFHYSDSNHKNKLQVDYVSHPNLIGPGVKYEVGNHLFTGAKKLKLLDNYASELHIKLFDRAIDFGWFYFLTKPMFYALQYFHSFLGNFGLAILLLTVGVKLLMYPLANKSYHSMNKMKKLQPDIAKIKERSGDDKMRFNKELMEMYKREGVSPLSGCMPILIQIPVFFSLYKVLFVTLEMRHAPFFGWIHDLSAPDPTSLFNLFGLIPWSPPGFLMIGAWPIIMGITMFFQQKMNPEPTDPVQAQVMRLLPLIFIFMFSSLPAGLIIYWAWNNILSIIQQLIINFTDSSSKTAYGR